MDRDIIKHFTVLNQYIKGINGKNPLNSEKKTKHFFTDKTVLNQYIKGIEGKKSPQF